MERKWERGKNSASIAVTILDHKHRGDGFRSESGKTDRYEERGKRD